jgi:hypothetical protein
LLNGIGPRLRFLPLILLPLCFLPSPNIATVVILLPPCLYLAVNIALKNYRPNFLRTRGQVRVGVIIAFIPLVSLVFRGYEYLAGAFYFHFVFAIIACGACLSRMLQNDEKTVSSPGFIALNLGRLASVFAALFVLGSPFVVSALTRIVSAALAFVYASIIAPVLVFTMSLFARRLLIDEPAVIPELAGFPDGATGLLEEYEPAHANEPSAFGIPEPVQWIIAAVFIAFAAFLVFKAIKRLLEGRMQKNPDSILFSSLPANFHEEAKQSKKPSFFTPRDPRRAVRHNYRRFLKICAEKGEPPDIGDTTFEVYQKNMGKLPDAPMSGLRELYIKARYSDKRVEKSEVKESGDLLKRF